MKKMYVAIGGYKGAGKNTVSALVVQRLFAFESPYRMAIVREMFAEPLKESAKALFKWDGQTKDDFYRALLQLKGDDERSLVARVQALMMERGMSSVEAIDLTRQHLGENFDPLLTRVLTLKTPADVPTIVFVTDCRMAFEFKRLMEAGAVCFWINREGCVKGDHITESFEPNDYPAIQQVANIDGQPELAADLIFNQLVKHMEQVGWI